MAKQKMVYVVCGSCNVGTADYSQWDVVAFLEKAKAKKRMTAMTKQYEKIKKDFEGVSMASSLEDPDRVAALKQALEDLDPQSNHFDWRETKYELIEIPLEE